MKVHMIRLNPGRPNFPLVSCFVGKLSSAVFEIGGDIPDDVEGMSVRIGRTPDPDTEEPRDDFAATASRAGGGYRCYLSPFMFPDASRTLHYHIIALDSSGNSRWLGSGNLEVLECPADGTPIAPDIIPADTYIRNPVTGLYHKLTAEVNDLGEIAITCESEGIQR
jgi:hypothetical protein